MSIRWCGEKNNCLMNKKIVLINQSSGYLTIDIANVYAEEYDEVVLLAGSVGKSERELSSKVIVDNLIKYNRSSTLTRVATWLISFVQILFKLLFRYRKYEVVYVTNPPISYLASLFVNNIFSIIVFDTYPDALRNIGVKQGNWLYDLWSKWNRKIFSKADNVFTLSEGMAQQLTNYISREHIQVIPLWAASESFKPIDKNNNPFIKKHNLQGKFVVMYSGNMGYTHNVDTLATVAKELKDNSKIHFLFIGDGKKKNEIMSFVRDNDLNNCTFLDWQPFDILPYSLASADLGVVTLNEETALTSVPSKTFNLMAVGAPLLCITTKQSEIAKIVDKYHNGFVCPATDVDEIVRFIKDLAENESLKQEMSNNSLVASKEFTYKNAEIYVQKLLQTNN